MNSKVNRLSKLKKYKNLDLLALAIYSLFTCIFFLERTSFLDNPFTLFKLINDGHLFVNANRYPAAIMQILPLIGIKTGASLKLVMFLHSLGYFLFHGVLFSIIRFILKDKEISGLLLVTLVIPVAHTFFWNNNELFLGLSGLCLWLALMRKGQLISSILTGIIVAWIHPLLFVIVMYITALSGLTKKISWKTLFPNVSLYAVSYFIKAQFFPNYYDTGKNEMLMTKLSSFKLESSIFDLISSAAYWPIIFCCIATLGLLIYYKKWLSCILLTGFILCYLILTKLTEGNPFYVFYNEGNFRVLFFVAAYTCIHIGLHQKMEWLKYVVALLVFIGFIRIGLTSNFYKERIVWYQSKAIEHDRQILTYDEVTKQQLIQSWASPFESIILSTLKGQSQTIIFSENPRAHSEEMKTNTQMITTQGRFLIYNPDNNYFRLQDKSYSYGQLD